MHKLKLTKGFIAVLIFVSCFLFSRAQQVIIRGTAPAYEYKEISVWTPLDYISNAQKKLTYSVVDSAGNFLLELSTKEIQYITLKIEKNIASMFIEPDNHYEVVFMQPDSTTYHNPNLEHDVQLSIKLKSKTEINALTMDYDKRFDDFLTFYFPSFVSRNPQPVIDSFKLAIHEYYSAVKNPYLDTYVDYSIASLEQKTKASEKKLFSTYLEGKPIQYGNPEYMQFFNAFFKQKIYTFSLSKSGSPITFQINDRGSASGAMSVLQRDPFLKNDTLCELVLLKGLHESYYDGSFKKSSIVPMLQQIAEGSKLEIHRQIASNILNSFSRLKPGAPAPVFVLPDKTGLTSSLDELRSKKYVYITFFNSACTQCLQQMKVLPSLKKMYGERISFVSISTDKTAADMKNFCAKNPQYDWLFLYDNSNGKLQSSYEIKTLPSYFLISPEGKFLQAPAPGPNEDIERAFYDIVKPKAKRHSIGSKKNN